MSTCTFCRKETEEARPFYGTITVDLVEVDCVTGYICQECSEKGRALGEKIEDLYNSCVVCGNPDADFMHVSLESEESYNASASAMLCKACAEGIKYTIEDLRKNWRVKKEKIHKRAEELSRSLTTPGPLDEP